jgi:hypothetical protein
MRTLGRPFPLKVGDVKTRSGIVDALWMLTRRILDRDQKGPHRSAGAGTIEYETGRNRLRRTRSSLAVFARRFGLSKREDWVNRSKHRDQDRPGQCLSKSVFHGRTKYYTKVQIVTMHLRLATFNA